MGFHYGLVEGSRVRVKVRVGVRVRVRVRVRVSSITGTYKLEP